MNLVDKTTLYLTPQLRRRLRDAARRSGRRQADLIRAALDAYLDDGATNRPRSIGAGEDAMVHAEATEDWLRERWHPHREGSRAAGASTPDDRSAR